MKATNIQSYTVKTVFSICFSISSNLLFHIFMCFLLLAFFLASRFFTTDDLPGLAYCVTQDSFIFSQKFSSQAFFLSLSAFLTNGGAQGTPSLPVYSFSFFLSLSFQCASARQTGSSLILAFYLCFLSVLWLICPFIPFFTVCPPLFLILIS